MKKILFIVAILALMITQMAQAAADKAPQVPKGSKFRPLATTAEVASQRGNQAGIQDQKTPSKLECRAAGDPVGNVLLDCDGLTPNNEPQIAVNPMNPLNMIASSNDYESCCDQFYTTFDGGQTWRTGDMSVEAPGKKSRTGSDPVTSFNVKYGTVIHSSLNFQNDGCDGDVVASLSKDGGIHWNTVVEVADAGGPTSCDVNGMFLDKEWMVTDNSPNSPYFGRTYVTWTAFRSVNGITLDSAIWEAHSDDGGFTWTEPHEISGSNPTLCTFQVDGPAGVCDENQFSVPTVGTNGTVYVSFINEQNMALWEEGEFFDDQFLLVKSTDGGMTWSAPTFIVGIEDGSRDYPLNANGRATLTNYQLRVASATNIVADPTSANRLYFVFFDNRNGTHDVDNPITNTDVFITSSSDGGASWSPPALVNAPDTGAGNDQWFPWVDVSPVDGKVGVLYNDRSYDPTFDTHEATLSESPAGGASFTSTKISTVSSHPRNSRFFRALVPGCEDCTRFHGDYIGLTYGSDGSANAVWTDMRDPDPLTGRFLQFIYFARR
ncbi:MAG TPA: sialidase family protein [Anaerolineales bacterium]